MSRTTNNFNKSNKNYNIRQTNVSNRSRTVISKVPVVDNNRKPSVKLFDDLKKSTPIFEVPFIDNQNLNQGRYAEKSNEIEKLLNEIQGNRFYDESLNSRLVYLELL